MAEHVVQRYDILAKLRRRFDLVIPGTKDLEPVTIPREILLVTVIDELLKTVNVDRVARDISAASGSTAYFTVPAGKRWTIKALGRDASTGNSRMLLWDGAGSGVHYLSAAGTAAEIHNALDLPLEEGWGVYMDNTNNGADTAINANIVYMEEDAYD